jgi:8-oxo-dGTP diphosphatase
VHVVAGVMTDARDRVLLARRTEGRDLAGLWEFPGGKREPDESSEAALARELHEELGIAIDVGAPLIAVPQQYPHKRLRLDVRRIASWRGTPKGLDGQALAWVPPHKLPSYAMPPADRPVVAALLQPDRYLVTPAPADDDGAWLQALELALAELERRFEPSLVIYLAGADPHEGDRLGRLKLTWDGLEARDRRVYDWAFQRRIPLAFAMAGGYGERIEDTVQAQLNTFRVAAQYWQRWQNQPR